MAGTVRCSPNRAARYGRWSGKIPQVSRDKSRGSKNRNFLGVVTRYRSIL